MNTLKKLRSCSKQTFTFNLLLPSVGLQHNISPIFIIRCFEALVIYFKAGKKEEPYVTLARKISLEKDMEVTKELEIGQTERMLATHRNAFKRTAVIQAFLGSTPQLTLQLYATIQEKYILSTRCKKLFFIF